VTRRLRPRFICIRTSRNKVVNSNDLYLASAVFLIDSLATSALQTCIYVVSSLFKFFGKTFGFNLFLFKQLSVIVFQFLFHRLNLHLELFFTFFAFPL